MRGKSIYYADANLVRDEARPSRAHIKITRVTKTCMKIPARSNVTVFPSSYVEISIDLKLILP